MIQEWNGLLKTSTSTWSQFLTNVLEGCEKWNTPIIKFTHVSNCNLTNPVELVGTCGFPNLEHIRHVKCKAL